MAELAPSPLSAICDGVAGFLRQALQDRGCSNFSVLVGSPAEAAKTDTGKHRANLFFYRVTTGGFGPGPASDEPWRIRLHCLITAFGVKDDKIPEGENDLRMLGLVMSIFHENPVLDTTDVGVEDTNLQVVFEALSSDDINHVWSTQGDVVYRPSVAYEMALVPIMPGTLAVAPRLVGSVGIEARGAADVRHESPSAIAISWPVSAKTVATGVEGWQPYICFVHGGECLQAVSMASGSAEHAAFDPPAVWIAGAPSVSVSLRWQVWDASSGWVDAASSVSAQPKGPTLDPETIPTGLPTISLPPMPQIPGQILLYASRSYIRGSDGATVEVRSNPLLVTLY